MKYVKKISILVLLLIPINVFAASASMSVASSVEVGSSVTARVTLSQTAAWNIAINSSGSTSGCSQKFADTTSNGGNTTKVLTVTCKATSIGAIGFTVTGDITSANGQSSNVSISKRVTVTAVRPKSTDNALKSLSVEGYTLTPEFNKDTLEYSVTVPSNVDKVMINATKNDSAATLEGTGEFEVTEGNNPFEIVVTAENGDARKYVVNVNVEDINPIKVSINNSDFTIVKNAKNLVQPNLYEPTTIKIGDEDIPAFYSETSKITLVGIKDAEGNIRFAIYNNEENSYTLYQEFTSNLILYITDFEGYIKGYSKDTITIDGKEVSVYRYKKDSRNVIVYAMNLETGEYGYYSYDTISKTFQPFHDEEIQDLNQTIKTYLYITCVFGGCLLLAIICIISLLNKNKKRKKRVQEIKNGKEQKNDLRKNENVIKSDKEVKELIHNLDKNKNKNANKKKK